MVIFNIPIAPTNDQAKKHNENLPTLLTGTVEDFKIQQAKWAGATGVFGESIIPTARDMYRSLTQKLELR